ncbi:hypothetical protein GGS21DRAFT_495241 [Xylaria nigripes]|nr:hypothetical protein GGS21DRAFT_495241 [Xylaria nigripes]
MTSATTTTMPSSPVQDSPLARVLAQALPKDSHFTAWHLSTIPAVTDALCYPPALNSTTEKRPSKPLRTYCEKHFLSLSITEPITSQDVLVLGLEIYIYSTAFSTTIFVSKADSTGYLHLQSSPEGFSPIRAVTVAFLNFLVEHRRRPSKQLIINLFARAQSQYLFSGSVKNNKKHILDDRGLIKWWCKVLNSLIEQDGQYKSTRKWNRIHGYLVIPGLDNYETRAFVPRARDAQHGWTLGDPLELISPYKQDPISFGNVPLRCLIPTYPDDPKARFVEELEGSTSEKAKLVTGWKIPKTFDQFWEMMAFRQECSSGRMTGFVWVVFDPRPVSPQEQLANVTSLNSNGVLPDPTTPAASVSSNSNLDNNPPVHEGSLKKARTLATPAFSSKLISASTKSAQLKRRAKKRLRGPIITREPRVKTHRAKYPDRIVTPYYYWPELGRGQVVLDENGYTRAVELLLHLEFKDLEQAVTSTSRWVSEVNMGENWALPIIGLKIMPTQSTSASPGLVNDLAGSIIRKRKSGDEPPKFGASNEVDHFGGIRIRKRFKVDADEQPADTQIVNTTIGGGPSVNVLGPGMVRKKSKAE